MTKRSEITSSANNSSATSTSTHETGLVQLTSNPYVDLATYGIDLHWCNIRYHRSPNNNGNTITGEFNISGRIRTAGATSYEGLISLVVQLHKRYLQYVSECHKRKRERNRQSWLSRHPEYVFYQCDVTINNY